MSLAPGFVGTNTKQHNYDLRTGKKKDILYPSDIDAIQMIQTVSKMYKVSFDISYKSHQYKTSQWVIKVMDKKFVDLDFVKAAQQAVSLVYNAHENKSPKIK